MENQSLELLSLILQCLLHVTPVHVSGYSVCWRVTGLDPGNVQSQEAVEDLYSWDIT